MNNREKLIALADQLDKEGKPELADEIDKNFEEFLQLLEEGKLDFDFTFEGGQHPSDTPTSNRGREVPLCGIDGPQ